MLCHITFVSSTRREFPKEMRSMGKTTVESKTSI